MPICNRRSRRDVGLMSLANSHVVEKESMENMHTRADGESRNRKVEPRGLSTMGSLGEAFEVLELAQMIEPRFAAAITWYLHTPIMEFGYLTARDLVDQGRAEYVVNFLKSVFRGERD
jgi:hypothetical protein